jgi:hypothetical protein
MDATARVHRGAGRCGGVAGGGAGAAVSRTSNGFLSSVSPGSIVKNLAAFRQGLKERGYPERQNVAVEYRWAEGHFDRLPIFFGRSPRNWTMKMKHIALAALFVSLFASLATATAEAQNAITEQEAHAIGVDAYLYFYPLVIMDLTRRQSTNVEPGKEFARGPMNMFTSVREYPPGNFKGVVRVNFDTLYSIAWLDMTVEPMIVSAPNTNGRYYLLPMLDMWTDVFASPGWRTTGTQATNFLVTPPGWNGAVPTGMTRISAPTAYVWIIGRTKTDGPPDYDAVHKIQDGYKVTPLSEWGPAKPVEVKIDPSVDMKTPPKVQVDRILRLCCRASQSNPAPHHR